MATDIQQGTREDTHHVFHEGCSANVDCDAARIATEPWADQNGVHPADGVFSLITSRTHRLEVMLANPRVGGLLHGFSIEPR